MPPNLFGSSEMPVIAGLRYNDEFVSSADQPSLIAAIGSVGLTPFRFQGWEGKRLTASFGWHYDFDQGGLSRATPFPEWLLPWRARAADFAGLDPDALVQALVLRYDPGAAIGWHRDRPQFENVIGISLCAPAILRLRRRTGPGRGGFERRSAPLTPGSIYHMAGEARHAWEHSIAPIAETRWSITFRSLSERGRRLVSPA